MSTDDHVIDLTDPDPAEDEKRPELTQALDESLKNTVAIAPASLMASSKETIRSHIKPAASAMNVIAGAKMLARGRLFDMGKDIANTPIDVASVAHALYHLRSDAARLSSEQMRELMASIDTSRVIENAGDLSAAISCARAVGTCQDEETATALWRKFNGFANEHLNRAQAKSLYLPQWWSENVIDVWIKVLIRSFTGSTFRAILPSWKSGFLVKQQNGEVAFTPRRFERTFENPGFVIPSNYSISPARDELLCTYHLMNAIKFVKGEQPDTVLQNARSPKEFDDQLIAWRRLVHAYIGDLNGPDQVLFAHVVNWDMAHWSLVVLFRYQKRFYLRHVDTRGPSPLDVMNRAAGAKQVISKMAQNISAVLAERGVRSTLQIIHPESNGVIKDVQADNNSCGAWVCFALMKCFEGDFQFLLGHKNSQLDTIDTFRQYMIMRIFRQLR